MTQRPFCCLAVEARAWASCLRQSCASPSPRPAPRALPATGRNGSACSSFEPTTHDHNRCWTPAPAGSRLPSESGTRARTHKAQSYASTNRRGRRATYPAVCGKRATLSGNADRAKQKSRSAGGTEQTAGMLSGHLFGPGGNTTPEDIGSMGGEYGPLRRRHSGKGRAVPGRCPSIPSRSSFRCARPIYATGFSAVVPAHAGRLLERRDQVASILARAIASMTSVSPLQRHEPTPR